MRLILFREKLAYEVDQAQSIIDSSDFANQRVQAHIYCIAALLRKIMTRVTTAQKIPVKVHETETRLQTGALLPRKVRDVPLLFLVNRIIHYFQFLPSSGFNDSVRILSDEDSNIERRDLNLRDFLDAARQICDDNNMVLNDLLRRSKKYLSRVVYSNSGGQLREIETLETLIDLFDAVRDNTLLEGEGIKGQVPVFYERRNPEDILNIIGVETREVEIRLLCEKLFRDWRPVPFRQFQPYEYQTANFELRGKMLDLESEDSEFLSIFMINAKDLLSVLVAIESQVQAITKEGVSVN